MAIILPFLGTIFTPGLAPAICLGLFIFCLALYRYKIERFEDPTQIIEPENSEEKSCEQTESCGDCHCKNDKKKIQRLSILYGTTTGNSKDFAWKLAQEAEEEGINKKKILKFLSKICI